MTNESDIWNYFSVARDQQTTFDRGSRNPSP
jgi:hypothetical protein